MAVTLLRNARSAINNTFQKQRILARVIHERKLKQKEDSQINAVDPAFFHAALQDVGINFICGVPDSLLKDICAHITSTAPESQHVITSNEGSAVALATGYHLATGQIGMVYMQNSGLGNIVNPVMSLAHRSVYSIPILLMIGWRGEPGKHDEPQHNTQGSHTEDILGSMGIPYQVLPQDNQGSRKALDTAVEHLKRENSPYCLLVRSKTFLPFQLHQGQEERWPLRREEVLEHVVDSISPTDVIVSTTGMLSRELFELRVARRQGHEKDFLTVGSMGHASSIALGIALQTPDRQVFCLDGDGAAIMHMGAMATIGQRAPANLKHVIINNGTHDSVGGQPTVAGNHGNFSFPDIATACGYKHSWKAVSPQEICDSVRQMSRHEGPVLLEVKCRKGHRKNLGRPTRTPVENKAELMKFLQT